MRGKNSAAIFLRLTLAHLMTSVTHSFWGKEGDPSELWDCLPLWRCLFAPASWEGTLESCPIVSSLHYMVKRVVLSPSSRFVSPEVTGALCVYTGRVCSVIVPQGCGLVFLASLHTVLPKISFLVLQMVFLRWEGFVWCVWPEGSAAGVSTPLPLLLLIVIEGETGCLRSDVAYCSVLQYVTKKSLVKDYFFSFLQKHGVFSLNKGFPE